MSAQPTWIFDFDSTLVRVEALDELADIALQGRADHAALLARIKHIQDIGVKFIIRGNHGMTHSVYISDPDGNGIEVLYEVPKEVWEHDVNGALNYFEMLPTEGPGSTADNTDYPRFETAK